MRLIDLTCLIRDRFGTVRNFAEKNGINYSYLSRALNGKAGLSKRTILKMVYSLGIPAEKIGAFFFPECFEL